ncbi:MAG: isochorismatase family cysteine hydrolase [Burkholderiales bacterium]
MQEPVRLNADFMSEFTHDFSLVPSACAFVVVDVQYASASRHAGLGKVLEERGQAHLAKYRFDRVENEVIPAIQRMLKFFRSNGLRVLYLTVGSEMPDYSDLFPHMQKIARTFSNTAGNREHEILDEIKPLPGEFVRNKTTTGAFASIHLDTTLRAMGITDLIFAGVSTDLCVDNTARAASDLGFNCILLDDGCATGSQDIHDATLRVFQRSLGRVENSVAVIDELERALGH